MVKEIGVQVAGEPMTKEELTQAALRVKGKKSPFDPKVVVDSDGNKKVIAGTPVKAAKQTGTLKRIDGSEVKQVGSFKASPQVGDSQTLKKFKRIMPNFSKPVLITRGFDEDAEQIHAKWVPMTIDEALKYQGIVNNKMQEERGILLGYDEDHGMGLLEVGAVNDSEDDNEEI